MVADAGLRASIEGMLTKVEHSNKFSQAIMLGNQGSFDWATQREQDIANGCRMLLMNAINLYNLLYLSERLRQCRSESERAELLTTILKSSTHTWHHINLAGEYDFSDETLPATGFDWAALVGFPLVRPKPDSIKPK
jgi:hypothetical protein